MLAITFIIAIIALIISILGYRRSGGAKELRETVDSLASTLESVKDRAGEGLKEQVEHLTSVTESLKERTADALDRLEKTVRGRPEETPPEEETPEQKPPKPKSSRTKRG